jgi:LVIVD repeat
MKLTQRTLAALASGLTMVALMSVTASQADQKPPSGLTGPGVAKVAHCAAGDHPEAALQGQVPAAMRANGFTGFNCNLKLEGQYAGNGGGVAFASVKDDHGHACVYYGNGLAAKAGTSVIDITDAAHPKLMTTLLSPAMGDPGEALRVNARRQLLAAVRTGGFGIPGGPEVDVYDLSADCRAPKLLASVAVGTGADGGVVAKPVNGHDSNFSPDGMTFYSGDPYGKAYSAIDLSDPTKPKLIAQLDMSKLPLSGAWLNGAPHGLSISDDGNRGYFVSVGFPTLADLKDPHAKQSEGFYVIDTSEVQARKPNAQMKLISYLTFKNGAAEQHTLSIKIGGKPYIVVVNEMGSGGVPGLPNGLGGGTVQDACNAGLTPFPMGRIVDISDETKPTLVADLGLETHDVNNCSKVLPDLVGEGGFTYGSHICSVDNRDNATALACGYWQSGIRVFDIRNPKAPKEIAYFNPKPAVELKMPMVDKVSAVDACAAPAGFDFERKLLTSMCVRSGALVLKFENGVWPMRESTPAPRGVSYN